MRPDNLNYYDCIAGCRLPGQSRSVLSLRFRQLEQALDRRLKRGGELQSEYGGRHEDPVLNRVDRFAADLHSFGEGRLCQPCPRAMLTQAVFQ